MSSKFIALAFIKKLSERAMYGIAGEKSLAIIAVLKYLSENKIIGKTLSELINNPQHTEEIRKLFIELAKKYSPLKSPSNSWSVITGTEEELQNAIRNFANINTAFSNLKLIEIQSLYNSYHEGLNKRTKNFSQTIPNSIKSTKLLNVPLGSDEWMVRFRTIILRYNEHRVSDPFMAWFRQQEQTGVFANIFERILIILIDSRFDQQTKAENALENTIQAFNAGVLEKQLQRDSIPLLIPRHRMTSEVWTNLFYTAIPRLNKLAMRIREKRVWSAEELLGLMRSKQFRVPYLGIKTSRLAVRWLHELIPELQIDMSSFKVPIDILVYRVASRLGLIDPNVDKYYGDESPADLKIQTFAKKLFPKSLWFLDEPLWSTGRQAAQGGHCYPTQPNHDGCIFEDICPKKYVDVDPSKIGMNQGYKPKNKTTTFTKKPKGLLTDKQVRFKEFIQQLKDQEIRGKEYREKVAEWYNQNS